MNRADEFQIAIRNLQLQPGTMSTRSLSVSYGRKVYSRECRID
jgi:hypothetical protein